MRPLLLALTWLLPLLAVAAPPTHPYADATRRRIATAQDERNTAALLPWLASKNPAYRAAAALAFGSVQDKVAVPALLPLLADKTAAVRRAAAFALGQTGDSTAIAGLARRWPLATDYQEQLALGEALGRCVTASTLPLLWQNTGADTTRSTAQAWGLYRATLRGLATAEAVRQTTALLRQPRAPRAARRGASAALARARGGAALDSALSQQALPVLLKALAADPDYYVQVNCVAALGRWRRPGVLPALLAATNRADLRVRVAALRALPAQPYAVSEAVVEPALRRPLAQEALTAAEWLLRTHPDSPNPAFSLLALARRTPHYRARAAVLQAALRYAPTPDRALVADTIRKRLARSASPYEQAALLMALSEDQAQLDFLAQAAAQSGAPLVVPGSALMALVALRGRQPLPEAQQAAFMTALRQALAGADVSQLSTAAEALADPKLVPATTPADLTLLRAVLPRLVLPRDVEAYQAVQQAIDKLTHAPQPTPVPASPRQAIDWALVQQVPVGQRVRITTAKGAIVLQLRVLEAPGSVATFVQLVRRHFYDGLYFHRVVPDFVAQGGDPRGDGMGSLPYTLRSELSYLRFDTGAVGLASAGKDTESCQFFFTHLPTPHLDGRYTVFAQVVEGQEVVQRLEVGDQMQRLELL